MTTAHESQRDPANRHLLNALAAAPGPIIRDVLRQIEEHDIHPLDRPIYHAYQAIHQTVPALGDRGYTVQALRDQLLESGALTDGKHRILTPRLTEIAGSTIDAAQIPALVRMTIRDRYITAVTNLGKRLLETASTMPLAQLDETLRHGTEELRRLRMRIPDSAGTLKAVS